jgi:hypothetical protein
MKKQQKRKGAPSPTSTPGSILDAMVEPPKPITTDEELGAAINEALEGAEASIDKVTIGGREITITHLPYGTERHMKRLIGPYLKFLLEAWLAGEDAFAAALTAAIVESDEDLTELAVVILQAYDPNLDEAWLNYNASLAEVIELVKAQVRKNKVADTLGKLWGRGVLSARMVEALNISKPPSGPTSTPSSSASASDTSSTPPTY